ncbi:AraC family transcriptional regulator [Kineosporia rhizophila]|uniref:AraC family transcriptional regulator n=1 Tax=Kineosporia rhizophila TaxID=84633 RepID=UPI001E3E79AB|nr:AraC family transcriptional regulator [Kineosporia rhizophila]
MDVLDQALAGLRIGRAQACTVRLSGTWGYRYPAFDGSGFHLLLSGSAWLLTSTDAPRLLTAGDVVLTPHGAEHGLSHAPAALAALPRAVPEVDLPQPARPDVELLCGAYWLEHGQVHDSLRALPDVVTVSPDLEGNPELGPLFQLMRAKLAESGPGSGTTRPALLDLMLTNLLQQWIFDHHDPAIARVLEQIHAAPERPWTVPDLSALAGLSKTTFSERFTDAVGRPPKRCLTSWRLARAAGFLRDTDLPLAAIARRVGYASEFALSSAFRREYGVAPGRFRTYREP